jgi:flagellar FliL protein
VKGGVGMRKVILLVFALSLWTAACGENMLQAESKAPTDTHKVTIGSFASNLSGQRRVISVSIDADIEIHKALNDIQENKPAIKEAIIQLISQKTFAELSSEDGKALLGTELAAIINKILGSQAIKRIYFTELQIE